MIRIKGLEVSFGSGRQRIKAVDGISFSVGRGEAFGLVGESGSGKSTVLRAICGLNSYESGEIEIEGECLGAGRSISFYKKVQMVFQDPYASLHPRHTVDTILNEPIVIHRLDRGEERILTVLDEVGLGPDFRFRYPHQLSGGQRQRIAVARALVLEPEILLLDEPTSALDVSVQAEVLNLLAGLRQRRNLTYILVSHNLAVIAHMCDRLAVMNHGRIVEEMEVADLRRNSPTHPYTRQLLTASLGYDRRAIDMFQDFSNEQ